MEFKSYHFNGRASDILGLFKNEPHVFLLESSLQDRHRGRFSFVGFDPFDVFQSRGTDRLDDLNAYYVRYAQIPTQSATPFPCGIFGYLSYDFGLHFEHIERLPDKEKSPVPECLFGFYDCVITIDHLTGKLHVASSGLPEKYPGKRKKRSRQRLESITKVLESYFLSLPKQSLTSGLLRNDRMPVLTSNFTKPEYLKAARRVLDYIKRGDIYQANLSQRFSLEMGTAARPDPFEVYQCLRELSPSHFGGYFDCGNFQIISSSPERFLSLRRSCVGDQVETRPMKGTRPRGKTMKSDHRNREELRQSPKDRAELLMITDLERNDLGRVCDYGSVKVERMRTLEEYKTVFQATSTVTGRLRKDKSPFDLLRACFPGGSITGCPKIRAMEIIEELEPSQRGIYTGSMGYISFSGAMDFNILIRTLLVRGGRNPNISFHVGGGIVADSVPQKEYAETLVKAKAMQECLNRVLSDPSRKNFSKGHPEARRAEGSPGILRRPAVSGTPQDDGQIVFLDRKFVRAGKNFLKSLTPGIIKSSGVFETLKVRDGQAVLFNEHFNRLEAGLKKIGLRLPYPRTVMSDYLKESLRRNQLSQARVRLMVWQQKGQSRARIAIVVAPYQSFSAAQYQKGFHGTFSELRCDERSPLANIKSIRYQPFYLAYQRARTKGYDEAILLNHKGDIVEGSRSNIFFIKDGVLLTPDLKCGCLDGITRRAVMKQAQRLGIPAKTGFFKPVDLRMAQEAFLTNSLWKIMPLTLVDRRPIGRGTPGHVTMQLMKKYKREIS